MLVCYIRLFDRTAACGSTYISLGIKQRQFANLLKAHLLICYFKIYLKPHVYYWDCIDSALTIVYLRQIFIYIMFCYVQFILQHNKPCCMCAGVWYSLHKCNFIYYLAY